MIPGKQSDLKKHLAEEYGIDVTRQAISLLVKRGDYRVKYTPEGRIIVDETAKLLSATDFGKRSKRLKELSGPAKNKGRNGETKAEPEEDPDIEDYLTGKKQITIATPAHIIRRYKDFQQAEKERINNEKSLKALVNFNQTADTVFNFLRPLRDDLLEVSKRVSALANMAESKQEAGKIISDEINRILKSRVGDDFKFDDELKKKIIQILRR